MLEVGAECEVVFLHAQTDLRVEDRAFEHALINRGTGVHNRCLLVAQLRHDRQIKFGEMSELLKKHSDRKHIAPLPDPSVTKPNLLVKAPRNAKPVGDKNGTVFGADR